MAVKIKYFVHGTTTDNEKDLATGWMSGELSGLGIEQSKKLGEQIAGQKFDAMFCSDLKRAVDSARFVFGTAQKIIQDSRLREINYGDLTGKPSEESKSQMADYVDKPFPNGESYRDVEKRITEYLKFLKRDYDGKHIAIVAHQAPQLALEVLLKQKTWPQAIAEDWRHTKSWQAGWEYIIA